MLPAFFHWYQASYLPCPPEEPWPAEELLEDPAAVVPVLAAAEGAEETDEETVLDMAPE